MAASETVTRERTGFQLESFEWADPERLEVRGRWYGVRGRRFVRPVLTVMVDGRRRRLLALLEHKPWPPGEGDGWIAAFPWHGSQDGVGEAELEVGSLTVDLPPPGGDAGPRPARASGSVEPTAAGVTGLRAAAPREASPPVLEPPDGLRPTSGATRAVLERDLAGARAELRRLQQRHENHERELRTELRSAAERLEAAAAAAREAEAEASALREALEGERASREAETGRLRAAEAGARAEAERERDAASEAGARAQQLHAEERRLQAEARQRREAAEAAHAELERLREVARKATAENDRLRQAARRAIAEAERLRAAVRAPAEKGAGEPTAEGPPAAIAAPAASAEQVQGGHTASGEGADAAGEPQSTVPFEALHAVAAVRKELATERATKDRLAAQVERLRRELAAAREDQPLAPPAPEPGRRPTKRIGAAARVDPPPHSGRLLGDLPQRPLGVPSQVERWGVRVLALVLVGLLLIALALIVAGVF